MSTAVGVGTRPAEWGVTDHQARFAIAIAVQLRDSRRRQRITQEAVSARTDGLLTQGAIANYESGRRSMRIGVFWAIARALDEDPSRLLAAAEREALGGPDARAAAATVDIGFIMHSDDPRLAVVRRWFALRYPDGVGRVTLNGEALSALAALMDLPQEACRRLLEAGAGAVASSTYGSGHG